MALLDIFTRKTVAQNESNSMYGQTVLGNNAVFRNKDGRNVQILYVTSSSQTTAGRSVSMETMTKNSTIMSCVGIKARALAQLPVKVMCDVGDGSFVNACISDKVGPRDKAKAKQVAALLANPNNFQSAYEFWYQYLMWHELSGEAFTLLWRKDQENPSQTPLEMYVLDSTSVTGSITPTRYPSYVINTASYGFKKGDELAAHQVMHMTDQAWHGSSGFNKGILASELVGLDQDIDIYANYVMTNGAKPSGMFYTDQVIPDGKFNEMASRIRNAWASMTGGSRSDLSRAADPSRPGQGMLLDSGLKYLKLDMLNLQDADAAALKLQTMKRLCALFGVPPAMLGVADSKYNNTQTVLDEFYKSTLYPVTVNIQQKLKQHLFVGFPSLRIEFDTRDFLKGAPIDQMNFASAGVSGGFMTPNEARGYLGMVEIEGGDELLDPNPIEPVSGSSPQDTGGGGGSQTRKMNIGK